MRIGILIVFICALLGTSCEGPIGIQKSPVSNLSEDNFYQTAEDMNRAVLAAYQSLQSGGMFNAQFYRFIEMRSDNTFATWEGGGNEDARIYRFGLTPGNSNIKEIWDDIYNSVMRCNIVLDKIDNIQMDIELKNQYKAEVRFLRALDYFYLVRFFGGVPLVTTQISPDQAYEIGRASEDEVYQRIVEDFEYAADTLPISYSESSKIGRATKGAALGMLAKVHLTRHEYEIAKEHLESIMAQGTYSLLPEYEQLWNLENENSQESLFEIQYKKGGTGTGSPFANNFAPRFSENSIVEVGGTGSENAPTEDMENAYESGDIRKGISMESGFTDSQGEYRDWNYVIKYMDVPFQDDDSDNNWIVLRYADILLMYAEVLNELNNGPTAEAYQIVNQIRDRADLEPLETGMTYNEFFLAIEQERRVELAFENHRWFDLKRTGRALEVMNSKREILGIPETIQEHQLLLPIPIGVIDTNNDIQQNPGY